MGDADEGSGVPGRAQVMSGGACGPHRNGLTARRAYVTLAVISSLAITATASGALPSWWWTPKHANLMVVYNNPQGIGVRGDATTVLKADCRGFGIFKRRAGVKVWHAFRCGLTFRDEDTGQVWTPAELQASLGMPRPPVYVMCSSKTDPNRVLRYGLGVPGCP